MAKGKKDGLAAAGASTRAVWCGEQEANWHGATQVPICQTAGFAYPDLETWLAAARGRRAGYIYSRNSNPTVAALEAKVQALENAGAAASFASGMAAIAAVLLALLAPGDRVVSVRDTYGGTNKLFVEFLPRFQIGVTLCETADAAAIEAALPGAQMLYLETPTNPTLKVLDIARLAAAARRHGALAAVDNTLATPINQQPLALGADLALHSATKFLGGHGDALGGVVCGAPELIQRIFHFREITGACLDPFAAYLLLRGMKTLALRVERQNQTALAIAQFLSAQRQVAEVFYPGLAAHAGHAIALRQMRGFGGVLSFALRGGTAALARFLPRLRHAHRAANLGAVETTVGPPATTSHVESTPGERAAAGIPEALVRYAAGIEDAEDLIRDLREALNVI